MDELLDRDHQARSGPRRAGADRRRRRGQASARGEGPRARHRRSHHVHRQGQLRRVARRPHPLDRIRDAVAGRAAEHRHHGGVGLRSAGRRGRRDGAATPRAPRRERVPLQAGRRGCDGRLPGEGADGAAERA